MTSWYPCAGDAAAIITTGFGGLSIAEVTIERVTVTKIVTTGGDFRIGKPGRFPDSFGPFKQGRAFYPIGYLVHADSQTANDTRQGLRKEAILSEAVAVGSRLAKGIRSASNPAEYIADAITELEAIRHTLEESGR